MPSLPTKSRPSSPKQGLLLQLKTKLLECFGDTTAHGYGRLANSESRPQRWFWILVCAAAFAAFSQQLYVITSQYMSKPLKTRASIGHEEKLAFPQVTLCNLNMIRRSHIPEDIMTEFPEILGERSKRRNASSATHRSSPDSSGEQTVPTLNDLPEQEIIIQSVLEKLADTPEETLMTYGHQIEDMILDCQYSRLECLDNPDMRKYWTHFWHTRYGNCYTFNKGVDENGSDTTVMTSSQAGTGLTLEINIEQDEYISHLSQEAGVRVFIGGQKEMPFPYEQGISVSPGFSTAIQIRKVVIGRLDPFRNKSCETRTDRFKESIFGRYNVTYTATACKVSCLVSAMNSSCGCVIFELKYSDMPTCKIENADAVTCINGVFQRFDNGSCNSLCKERCREDVFKTTVSLAKWPSTQYKETLDTEIQEEVHGNHSGETSDHFLKIKVYYGELNFEVIEEEEAYTTASFLSDIGGLMGMWIGISVLTVVELLELIVTLFITIFKLYSKKKDRVVNIKNANDMAEAD